MLGREVLALPATRLDAGMRQHLRFGAVDLPAGVYFHRIAATANARASTFSGRMIVAR